MCISRSLERSKGAKAYAVGNKKNNIIEINGERYDARTGAPLGSHSSATIHPSGHHRASADSAVRSIPVRHEHHAPAPVKKMVHDAVRHAKTAKSHAPERSKTLMRHTVKKPSVSLKRRIKAHSPADSMLKKPAAAVKPKLSVIRVDENKLSRASQTPKSQLIKRFSKSQSVSVAIPVTVRKTVAPTPIHRTSVKPPKSHPPKNTSSMAEMLNRALQEATSHQEPPPKKVAKKLRGPSRRVSIITLTLSVLVLGGFIAYGNLTNVRLKVASAKAGFSASLPERRPAGFKLSQLNYSPGVVALHYHNDSDGRAFAVTEKVTAWDTGTLRDTYVASSGENYQTIESGGRTLYLFGKNTATWVNGGVWYRIYANGSLSHQQLVALATSM